MRFERDLSFNLIELYEDIVHRRYKVGRSICFIVDRPVKREVFAASFRDRIVHHLLYLYLLPVFEPLFIHDSYSCRVGKGTRIGIDRLDHHIRSVSNNYTKPCWVLMLDLQGYFMSIDRGRLYQIIVKTLKAKGKDRGPEYDTMIYLLQKIIFNDPTKNCYMKGHKSDWIGLTPSKSLFHSKTDCGLPIGNLTSQLFSNIYLNELDQYVKRALKCKHYGRYVDDFFIVDADKKQLLSLIPRLASFLDNELGLTLHPKKILLQRQDKGIPFLGCVLKSGKHYLSPRGRKMMMENLDNLLTKESDPYRIRAAEQSYKGYLSGFEKACGTRYPNRQS